MPVAKENQMLNSELIFADENSGEDMQDQGTWKVMIVDDEPEVHSVTELALGNFEFEGKPLEFINAYSGEEAKLLIQDHFDTALILLDVVMEKDDSGLKFVQYVRNELKHYLVRIILRTGQPGYAPEKQVIVDYDINDYKSKAELTATNLFASVVAALRGSRDLRSLEKTRNELEEIAKAAGQFVPIEFLKHLEKKSIVDVKLGDCVQLNMSVLFADIRSFASLSENMSPQENFQFLNSFLKLMGPHITEHNGFIDKYIGDAIMSLFDSPENAVSAAIAMLRELRDFNEGRGKAGDPLIRIGTGINTGTLMLGTIGGINRMEGTVISDAVNLASRIEQLTKAYKTPLLISEKTYSGLPDPGKFCIRFLDRVKVKGKSQGIAVYEVFDADSPAVREGKIKTQEIFEKAWSLYGQKDLSGARGLFEECLAENPGDTVAKIYVERCLNPVRSG